MVKKRHFWGMGKILDFGEKNKIHIFEMCECMFATCLNVCSPFFVVEAVQAGLDVLIVESHLLLEEIVLILEHSVNFEQVNELILASLSMLTLIAYVLRDLAYNHLIGAVRRNHFKAFEFNQILFYFFFHALERRIVSKMHNDEKALFITKALCGIFK